MQTSFASGEFSPLMEGHIDLERHDSSVRTMQGLIPLKQGPVVRRGGTKFIKEVKTSASHTALIPFEFDVDNAYQIEMGDDYFRFFKDNGAIIEGTTTVLGATQADPVVITDTGHPYSDGDEIYLDGLTGSTELNGKYYLVSNSGANDYELTDVDGNDIDGTGHGAYAGGGTAARVYEVVGPYDQSDLFDSNLLPKYQYAQSADVLYLVHNDYATRSLSRTSDTNWTVNEMIFNDGPYLPENTETTTFTLSGTTGSVTVTASATTGINNDAGFASTDIGRVIRFKDPANEWTWLKITAFTSTTEVTALISGEDASAGTATTAWRLGVYSETTGYPKVITFFQDRVFLASSTDYPNRWDISKTGGYSDTDFQFGPSDADGTVTDDAAFTGTLQTGQVNAIQWAGSDERGLAVGTAGREWIITSGATDPTLTPSNAEAKPFSSIGSAPIQPAGIENGNVFIQRARRKVHDVIYSFERDQLKPRDITLASEHIARTGVAEISFQKEPLNNIWMRRTDGKLIGITYYPDEAVFAAHNQPISGTELLVTSMCTTPSADGSRDELTLIVERTINGVTRKYVEFMTRYYEDDINKEDAIVMDSALTYDSTATATITGLDHLEGETVKLMVDGNAHPDLVVSGGSVTLENDVTGSTIQIGLGNTWILAPQRFEGGSKDGVSQGKTKRITGVVVRLLNTLGFKYGPDADTLDEYDFEQGQEYNMGTDLYTGDTPYLRWPSGYDQEGFMYFTDDGVFPATILSIMPQAVTSDR